MIVRNRSNMYRHFCYKSDSGAQILQIIYYNINMFASIWEERKIINSITSAIDGDGQT